MWVEASGLSCDKVGVGGWPNLIPKIVFSPLRFSFLSYLSAVVKLDCFCHFLICISPITNYVEHLFVFHGFVDHLCNLSGEMSKFCFFVGRGWRVCLLVNEVYVIKYQIPKYGQPYSCL